MTGTTAITYIEPLDDALEDLRISGSVLLHETYRSPWAIAVPDEARLRGLLAVAGDARVMPFHLVRRGGFDLTEAGGETLRLEKPELSLVPGGTAHRLSVGRFARVVTLEAILSGDEQPASASPDAADATELVCGAFVIRAAPLNPLLRALPQLFKVAAGGAGASPMLAGVANLLATELGRRSQGDFSAQRLLEVLCAEAIRAYCNTGGAGRAGWFKGLADPKIAEAIGRIHRMPGEEWTVDLLADGAALSASRFAARFRATMAESVMGYVGRWRANVACRLLRETDLPLARIANQVGYASLPAFSRAFKSQVGTSPGAWRTTD